jgi:hypothetical protein
MTRLLFLSSDVDGVEQRNGGGDFVGLFDGFGITVYRQGANFFWV